MAKTKLWLLVVCFAVYVVMCKSWVEDVAEEETNAKDEDVKQFAAEIFQSLGLENDDATQNMRHKAEEETNAIDDVAKQFAAEISQSLGLENDDGTQNMKYKAEDAASRATDTMKSAASGASEYASQKATDTKEAISGATSNGREKTSEAYNGIGGDEIIRMPTGKVTETYEDAKQKLNTASDKDSNMAQNVKNKMGCGGDKVDKTFDQAKGEVGEAYMSARDSTSEQAKAKYEAAKEKASEATGNLGAKMRNTPEP